MWRGLQRRDSLENPSATLRKLLEIRGRGFHPLLCAAAHAHSSRRSADFLERGSTRVSTRQAGVPAPRPLLSKPEVILAPILGVLGRTTPLRSWLGKQPDLL